MTTTHTDRRVLLEIERIRTDGGTQPRVEMHPGVVEEYAEVLRDGGTLPPLVVYQDVEGIYWLASGFHRLAAARLAGRTHVDCTVRRGSLREARLFAASTNGEHGLRRTPADQYRAVHLVLADDEGATWTDEHIAQHCRVSLRLVRALRVSTPWTPPPGLFGEDDTARPPAPDYAREDVERTRERLRRASRKWARFAASLGLALEDAYRELLLEMEDEVRRFHEAKQRRELRARQRLQEEPCEPEPITAA